MNLTANGGAYKFSPFWYCTCGFPVSKLVDSESTPVIGSVATTQQADLRFDKEAMLKMIRESWERSHQGFTIPCAQTAHTRYLIFC